MIFMIFMIEQPSLRAVGVAIYFVWTVIYMISMIKYLFCIFVGNKNK